MRFEQELVEEIRISNEIVSVISEYVPLKQKGNSFFGLCPFHSEKTPSFSVSQDKQLYYCFGCGASGNVISFIMQVENYDFIDALKVLADRVHINLEEQVLTEDAKLRLQKKAVLYEIHQKAARFYYDNLKSDKGKAAAAYLRDRRLYPQTLVKYGLGFASNAPPHLSDFLISKGFNTEDLLLSGLVMKSKNGKGFYDRFFNRVVFPIFDVSGKVMAFGGRVLDDGMPKYLNSPDTPIFDKSRSLYGLNFARRSGKRALIVVEGYMDAISLYQNGFHQTVAALGTAFTLYHARLLKKYADQVILLFDSDEAGTKAALRAIPILVSSGLSVKVAQTENAKDPDSFLNQYGKKAFEELIQKSKSHIAFQVACAQKRYQLDNTDGKIGFTKEAAAIINHVSNAIEQDAYIKEVAAISQISQAAIREEIDKLHIANGKKPLKQGNPSVEKRGKSKTNQPKGLLNAQKTLLNLMAANPKVTNAVKAYITVGDFMDKTYQELFQLLLESAKEDKMLQPAEITSFFEQLEDQKKVSDIFALNLEYVDIKQMEKDINDQLKIILNYRIEKEIKKYSERNDAQMLLKSLERQRNTNNLYISLTDG